MARVHPIDIHKFLVESNRIEGITKVIAEELGAAQEILNSGLITKRDLANYVNITAGPGACLRSKPGDDVFVGTHRPIRGGPAVVEQLELILELVNQDHETPYHYHHRYETLHPFMDGNGRSGRLLWAWQMLKFDYWPGISLGFLHAFYYQTLEHGRD